MEQSAATAFGITAAASGVVGVPMGGRLADRVLARYVGVGQDGGSANGGGEGVDDSLRYPIAASLMGRIWVLVLLALLVIFPTLAIDNPVPFLSLLFVGWTLLFGTQTGITLTAMLSVDRSHRPNALVRCEQYHFSTDDEAESWMTTRIHLKALCVSNIFFFYRLS